MVVPTRLAAITRRSGVRSAAASAIGEPVSSADQPVENAGLVVEVTAVGDDLKLDLGPGLLKFPGGARRGAAVVPALDDDAGDAPQPLNTGEQLPFLQPTPVRHVMVLDPGDCDRVPVLGELLDHLGVGQQGDGLPLPGAPRL